jgi:glycogen operon protein
LLLRRGAFSQNAEVQFDWHGVRLHAPDWSHESRSLALHLHGRPENRQDHIYLIANAHWEPHEFELPILPRWEWTLAVDTSRDPPLDITDPSEPETLANPLGYVVNPRSVIVLVGREAGSRSPR